MTHRETVAPLRIEPRWPPMLAVALTLLLLAGLSGRVRAFPVWTPYLAAALIILPMAGVTLTAGHGWWRAVERWATLFFFGLAGMGMIGNLTTLIGAILGGSTALTGLQLFTSSIAAWLTNVLIFSLLYWTMDRGGPEARANDEGVRPDWLFPQAGAPESSPPQWRPTFVDYLYLGYSTATAFSATDALPLTGRAKLLMMLESLISLATIVVVAARAINILGS